MRKKKEDRASWVVHKPPAEMPPESPRTSARAAEGSAQEAGSQPPEKLPPSASTDALPTPRLFTASESASSDSIGHPAPPAKTYSEIVGILEEAGAASEPVPVAPATPSSAQRQPDAASDATSTAFAFDPEQRYNAGVKTPLIPPLGLFVAKSPESPSLVERVSSGIGGLLGGLGGLLLPKGEDAAPVLTKEQEEEAAAVRIQARLPPSPPAQTPPPALTPSAALASHPPAPHPPRPAYVPTRRGGKCGNGLRPRSASHSCPPCAGAHGSWWWGGGSGDGGGWVVGGGWWW